MRHKKTRDIVIDLTSLLDVVMILIFAVMIKNTQLVEASNQKADELQEENAAMQSSLAEYEGIDEELANALGKLEEGDLEALLEQLHNAENQLDAYEYMDDIAVCYNIGLENRYNNTARCLTYGLASDENYKTFDVKRTATEEWSQAVTHFKLDLAEYIDQELQGNAEDKYIYLIFSVDKTKVYSNDYDDIEKILMYLETEYDGKVIYKLNILESE